MIMASYTPVYVVNCISCAYASSQQYQDMPVLGIALDLTSLPENRCEGLFAGTEYVSKRQGRYRYGLDSP